MEETRTKTRVERKKKKVWPWVVAAVAVVAVAVVACVLLWPRPLVTAPGYIAADLERAEIYNEEGGVAGTPARGTQVTYVVEEEDEDYPGLVRLVMGEEEFAWVKKENLVDDPSAVVTTQKMYVRTAVNLLDQAGEAAGYLADKGQELTVTGFEQLDEQGVVGRYQVSMTVDGTTHEGYVRAGYLCRTQEEALKQYDEQTYQLHVERGDSWGGGDAAGLDYFPREKAKFADNVMPTEVKSLYLMSGAYDFVVFLEGKIPSFIAHRKTYGNSSPFAE